MEGNKKIFTKKNIIIGIGILLVVVICVILVLTSKSNRKKDSTTFCTYTRDYGIFIETVDMNVVYNEEMVKTIQYESKYEIINEDIKNNMDSFEQNLRKTFYGAVTEKSNLEITRNDNTVLISYFVDYVNFTSDDFKVSEYIGLGSENEVKRITIDELKNSIRKFKGSCS